MDRNQWLGFKVFLRDKQKKNYFRILWEFTVLWISKKELPLYYFKYLYRKDVNNIKDFLGTKEAQRVKKSPKLHRKECMAIMDNKLSFSLFCKENKLPMAELVSHNFRSSFFWNGERHVVSDKKMLEDFFAKVFAETKKERLFLKPLSSYGGMGIFVLSKSNLVEDIEKGYKNIVARDYIHEDALVQHEEIDKIHAGCINTIRFDTYVDRNNKVHVLNAFMRFGIGKNVVDNVHLGGVYVGVNMEDGTLKEYARGYEHFGYSDLKEHPESNFPFKGFVIPHFAEACQLVTKATEFLPDRYIGWDIAITKDGPVVIEANQDPGIFSSDVTYGGYLQHPVYKEILEEVKDWVPA